MTFILKGEVLLDRWQAELPDKHFPGFDPKVVMSPHTLILLESPGPGAKNSSVVSVSNKDPTAKELLRLIEHGFGKDAETGFLCWNAIPWYTKRKPNKSDIAEAKLLHDQLLEVIRPHLKCVVLLGTTARNLLPYFSPRVGMAHIYGGHHPGRQAQNQMDKRPENEAVFRMLGSIR